MSKDVMYLGLDVHAENIAVALAEAGRDGEVRNDGKISNDLHGEVVKIDKLIPPLFPS